MEDQKYFISFDWGTSNFRLRLVETSTLKVIDEIKSGLGIKALNESYTAVSESSRISFFSDYLASQVALLKPNHEAKLIVVSGMASSNIGLVELPYADMPLDASGKNICTWKIPLNEDKTVLLVSGVKSKDSVMRGEEVQAIGLADNLQSFNSGLLVLPGTHSKHLTYRSGFFTEMKTYMTGELFDLISSHSILASSILKAPFTPEREKSFLAGVKDGNEGKLSSALFTIRAKSILYNEPEENSFYYLSGLLIGSELSGLNETEEIIFLSASEPMFSLYSFALKSLVADNSVKLLDESELEFALLKGQRKLMLQHAK